MSNSKSSTICGRSNKQKAATNEETERALKLIARKQRRLGGSCSRIREMARERIASDSYSFYIGAAAIVGVFICPAVLKACGSGHCARPPRKIRQQQQINGRPTLVIDLWVLHHSSVFLQFTSAVLLGQTLIDTVTLKATRKTTCRKAGRRKQSRRAFSNAHAIPPDVRKQRMLYLKCVCASALRKQRLSQNEKQGGNATRTVITM